MTTKTLRISYWAATIVFALLLAMDGIGGITQAEAGKEALAHLGYPMYLFLVMGMSYWLRKKYDVAGKIPRC